LFACLLTLRIHLYIHLYLIHTYIHTYIHSCTSPRTSYHYSYQSADQSADQVISLPCLASFFLSLTKASIFLVVSKASTRATFSAGRPAHLHFSAVAHSQPPSHILRLRTMAHPRAPHRLLAARSAGMACGRIGRSGSRSSWAFIHPSIHTAQYIPRTYTSGIHPQVLVLKYSGIFSKRHETKADVPLRPK
jgi:hypothetical protein